MNHCREISGSIRSPERWENGTVCVYCLGPGDQALLAQLGDHRSLGLGDRHAHEPLGASSVIRPSSPITLIWSRPWRRPISKSFGS